jgi:outer membrane immunogenic protein
MMYVIVIRANLMKSLISRLTLIAAFSVGSAMAADLPSRKEPPVLPPPPPPPPMWTGFTVGLNAGYLWSSSNNAPLGAPLTYLSPTASDIGRSAALAGSAAGTMGAVSLANQGFIGGGQVGYNLQVGQAFVVGLEADIQGVAAGSSRWTSATAAPWGDFFLSGQTASVQSISRGLDYLGTVRGRVGYLIMPTLLAYATGGLAYGGVQASAAMLQSDSPAAFNVTNTWGAAATYSNTRAGWTVGGGLEWMFLPNWSAKVEYLYYDLGSVRLSLAGAGKFYNENDPNPGAAYSAYAPYASTRFNGNVVRAGVNYHFNWGSRLF